ncbi:hypothetical protein E4634_10820 [Mangrovimicrobium sediminis]|uniref:Uncharacterized protein n=1 Tax=Mangrovimicrobium sediminis TaxID=2562682 RepID=A0A4Z0M246_9GAMM|nr:hypothetical protein [Haliea sp. SAOS-164]TGD73514.1 hypothetical protein E4634_10820 [Haliea sp. SAOS-164]
MGLEFNIAKDTACICATITELAALDAIIFEEIGAEDFHRDYDSLLQDILNTYRVVVDTLQPLAQLTTAAAFSEHFDTLSQEYSQHYQPALSKARINAEFTYEKYLQFRKRREVGTGYPPLQRAFARLHEYIDKWIDNDIWLAMTIDTLFKHTFRFLGEVAEVNKGDRDAAFQLYVSCMGGLPPLLAIIGDAINALERDMAIAANTDTTAVAGRTALAV